MTGSPLFSGRASRRIRAAALLGGNVLGTLRTLLPQIGRRDRVDKAAEQEVIRLTAMERARHEVRKRPAGMRADRGYEALGFVPPRRQRAPARTAELLGFAPLDRRSAHAMELLGFVRRPGFDSGGRYLAGAGPRAGSAARLRRQREMERLGFEIGR